MTDAAILEVLSPVAKTNITLEPKVFLPFHPNGILFQSFDESGEELDNWTIYSIGGGTLANETYNELTQGQVYEMHTIKDIQACVKKPAIPTGNMSNSAKVRRYGTIWPKYGK